MDYYKVVCMHEIYNKGDTKIMNITHWEMESNGLNVVKPFLMLIIIRQCIK